MSIRAEATIGTRRYEVALDTPRVIAIPVQFDGPQPNAFGLPSATASPFTAGEFVADTRHGGSINCAVVTITPHGNGTHTECSGHITLARLSVADVLPPGLFTAAVVDVDAEPLGALDDTYPNGGAPTDLVVGAHAVRDALSLLPDASACDALVVRTRLDGVHRQQAAWSDGTPPYFTREAMEIFANGQWTHLLTDLPSIDRDDDGGALANHRAWWNVAADRTFVDPPSDRTITEMIDVANDLPAGLYALTIDIPAFALDAAPSRPTLYPLRPLS